VPEVDASSEDADAKVDVPPDLPDFGDTAARVKATKIRLSRVGSVDLLLVVDNSISMADKQSELGRRIPQLIKTLTNPDIDPTTGKPKTPPIADLHVGIISTALGSHGTSPCRPSGARHNDDHGHLLPRDGEGGGDGFYVETDSGEPKSAACPTPVAASPITWVFDPTKDPKAMFHGPEQSAALQTSTSCVVQSVNDDGCGLEATLESMYHFLIDPAPYETADVACKLFASGDDCGTNSILPKGVDSTLLAQRNAFLRPDSLLAIVILSDENDASLHAEGTNWLPWALGEGLMPRGWAACEKAPDDFEPDTVADYTTLHTTYGCWSCNERPGDPNCSRAWPGTSFNNDIDARNMRAFHHVQRFGHNYLWGRARYVDGLTKATVVGSDGKMGPNPIFAGGLRTRELVVVAGIVGVPKPLVTDSSGNLKALTEADWDKLISPDLGKRDLHMIESIAPRAGIAKYAGDPTVDPINGGDRDVPGGEDLQYACIAPRVSSGITRPCEVKDAWKTNPLCAKDGTQPRFKAYPGLRELRVLHDIGASGLVASICDKSFSPAIQGLTDRLQRVVSGQCLFTPLDPMPTGELDCLALEVFPDPTYGTKTTCETIGGGYCTPGFGPCHAVGTSHPPQTPHDAAETMIVPITVTSKDGSTKVEEVPTYEEGGNVYATGSDGKKHLVCETMQLAPPRTSDARALACRTDPAFALPSGSGGWCYTRDKTIVGEQCLRGGSIGQLRFVGDAKPKNGSEVFVLCGK